MKALMIVTKRDFFDNAWTLFSARYSNLVEFCGGSATKFLGTSTVESDLSVPRWEKGNYCKSILDFGLEDVLQTRQYMQVEALAECDN